MSRQSGTYIRPNLPIRRDLVGALAVEALPHQVTGVLGDNERWKEVSEWVDAARVRKALQVNRLGLMGHYYGGMLDDMVTDLTQVASTSNS